nr:hypothetical protein [Tanacetum cinerariifolium]
YLYCINELEQEKSKKQKVKDDKEKKELKKCLKIIPDDGDDVTIDATPLSSKPPTIVDYKIYKEGRKCYFQIFRADGNSQMYFTFREDCWDIKTKDFIDAVKDYYYYWKKVNSEYVMENVLMGCGGSYVGNHRNKRDNKYKESTLCKRIRVVPCGYYLGEVYVKGSELLIPTPWSDESKNEKMSKDKGTEVMKDKFSHEHMCEEEVPSNNNIRKQSGDLIEMPSEVVEHRMDDCVPDEIDGAKGEHVSNHVVKKGNLEFLVWKQVANHSGDELVDKGRPLKRKKMYAE